MYRRFFLRAVSVISIAILTLLILPGVAVYAGSMRVLQAAPSPLEQLLARVADSQVSRTVMWYGSLADLESVLGLNIKTSADIQKLPPTKQLPYLLDVSGGQVYYSPFCGLDHPVEWQQLFGINAFAVEHEVTVGEAPDWYGILEGQFSTSAVGQALQKLGYTQDASTKTYSLGADNADPGGQIGPLAGSRYDRVVVANTQIIAAPSQALIQEATSGGQSIVHDPAYSALVRALADPQTIPTTQLVSAALFGGPYLIDKVLTSDPLAASMGSTLSADQLNQLRAQLALQNEKLLPRYETAGIGYRRSAKARYWLIGLVYSDANNANQASQILTDRLKRYASFKQSARQIFQGWQITSKVSPSDDGKFQVVTVAMQLPAQTDVSWIKLIEGGDIGFLAAHSG